MQKLLEIARTGLSAILLHPQRSAVTIASLVAILLPYLAGIGLSKGIQQQAEDSIRFGADVYVTGRQFGRKGPIPLLAIDRIQQIEGVTEVVPRIVGSVSLGKDRAPAVVVGIPADMIPNTTSCVEGRLYGANSRNEFVVGTELARQLNLQVGSLIPPFYRSAKGERISTVVGIFRSDVSIWQSRLILTSFETAAAIFDETDVATDLLVYCRPGYQANVSAAIGRMSPALPDESAGQMQLMTTAKEDLAAIIPRGLLHREGIFNLHFLLAFAVGISTILVTSGIGLSERRREIGILKATGWQTDEILFRSMVESFLLGVVAASISIVGAFAWLRGLNGYWVASIFLSGVEAAPSFEVPSRLTPIAALLSFVFALVIVMSGTLYSSWRAATVAPADAMR